MNGERHVAVVGGGISGLVAARSLARGGDVRVTLLEADGRLGGKIRTETVAGRRLDVGAEALLARTPAALELCHELGLEHDLVAPASDQPFVWTDRLRPLPPRLMAGAPDGSQAVIASGILSPLGLARAGLDMVIPARPLKHDVSIGSLVRRRLGSQVLDRLIDPLLGGIHAGNCDELSVRAGAPQLELALQRRRSLVRGLRALAGGSVVAPAGPTFLTLNGGLGELIEAIADSLDGVTVRTGAALEGVSVGEAGGVSLALAAGETLEADHVVLAVPAYVAAEALAQVSPAASRELAAIRYASVATLAFAYPREAIGRELAGSGFLVPRDRGRTMTACTWSSVKWAHLAGDSVLLKCSAGHAGNRDAVDLSDEQLLDRVGAELAQSMDVRGEPVERRVFRFERALPQYAVGHLERVARIDAAMADLPRVTLCGAAYRGVGVSACVKDGEVAAGKVRDALAARGPQYASRSR